MPKNEEDLYRNGSPQVRDDRVVQTVLSIIADHLLDDEKAGTLVTAWLNTLNLTYREASGVEQMRVLIGFRSEIVAASVQRQATLQ